MSNGMPEYGSIDITVRDEGTLVLFTGVSNTGETWLAEHLDPECQRFGPAYVVEHRYAKPIIEGALDEDLALAQG